MIDTAIEEFVSKLIRKTNDRQIQWNLLSELLIREKGFPDTIRQAEEVLATNEFSHLLIENSFYFPHRQGVVALLRIDNESGKDGSHSDGYAMLIQIRKNYPIRVYEPSVLQQDLSILYMAILDQINEDISLPTDLYDFMQSC